MDIPDVLLRWKDGRETVQKNVDVTADTVVVPHDGRLHGFTDSGKSDHAGRAIFVEE